MRYFRWAGTLALVFAFSAHAQYVAPQPQSAQPAQSTSKAQLIEQGSYTNVDGQTVHRPAHTLGNQVPAGASAQCRDGTYSFSAHRRGTCSHHGGVVQWLGLVGWSPRYISQKCDDLADAQEQAQSAADDLQSCLASADGSDDCDSEMSDATDAHDQYESALSDAEDDCE